MRFLRNKKNQIFVLFMLAVAVCSAVASKQFKGRNHGLSAWHYKMTVVVDTPEGIKTGSAVREMGNSAASSLMPEAGNPADVRGEAVVVDLGKRGVLFALISHQSDLEFYNAFPVPGKPFNSGGSTPEGINYYASLPAGAKGILNPQYPPGYPKLVAFMDLNDPKSVVPVQIWTRNERGLFDLTDDRMEQLFGEGVKLKEIVLQITDEPVTWEIEKWLPWIQGLHGGYLHGGITSRKAPLGLHGGNFKRE